MHIDKSYFTLPEILERWQITEADLIYLAENDKLRLSVRVFGAPMEFGDIDEDTRRCEMLVARIKLLRAANSAARHGHEICEAAAAQRAGFHRALLAVLEAEGGEWQRLTGDMADDAAAAGQRLEEARRAHEALQMALARCERELAASRDAHANLLDELVVLATPLAAAA